MSHDVSLHLINIRGRHTKAEMRNKKARITSRHLIDGLHAFVLVSYATFGAHDVSSHVIYI